MKPKATGASRPQGNPLDQPSRARTLGFFESYLTVWVLLCMAAGIGLGAFFPAAAEALNSLKIAEINLPVAVFLFAMMFPIMLGIDFGEVVAAVRHPKPVLLTLVVNWAIKPFTIALLAWLFMQRIWAPLIPADLARSYQAGMILLGIAPCTAMVLVWSYLAKASMGHTLVMVLCDVVFGGVVLRRGRPGGGLPHPQAADPFARRGLV